MIYHGPEMHCYIYNVEVVLSDTGDTGDTGDELSENFNSCLGPHQCTLYPGDLGGIDQCKRSP